MVETGPVFQPGEESHDLSFRSLQVSFGLCSCNVMRRLATNCARKLEKKGSVSGVAARRSENGPVRGQPGGETSPATLLIRNPAPAIGPGTLLRVGLLLRRILLPGPGQRASDIVPQLLPRLPFACGQPGQRPRPAH